MNNMTKFRPEQSNLSLTNNKSVVKQRNQGKGHKWPPIPVKKFKKKDCRGQPFRFHVSLSFRNPSLIILI